MFVLIAIAKEVFKSPSYLTFEATKETTLQYNKCRQINQIRSIFPIIIQHSNVFHIKNTVLNLADDNYDTSTDINKEIFL